MDESRRAFLSTVGIASVGGTVALAGCAGNSLQDAKGGTTTATQVGTTTKPTSEGRAKRTVTRSKLRAGTEQETTVYEIQSGKPGSTAYVIGGMHGNEESGYWAARDIRTWKIDAGTLVVLPEANGPAIEEHRRECPGEMDLNRQFPIGEPPKNALANEMWNSIMSHDPDVLIDLHSSKGILRRGGDDGVGQNVFRSRHDAVTRSIHTAIELLNDEYVTGYNPIYDFVQTPIDETKYATGAILINKTRIDLDIPSCLFEVTQDDVKPEKRARWSKAFVASMLDTWGIRPLQTE
ncbi:succinylglutamate desuccinylase/aspartoacylase family protein [Haladaptatus caseinilyticus]|uniref:succinylglutamate desuccinylase/aspartoacylase family protein n=1 Tax=Haladaptatus caseinilyticus TaxID=2993314 RepID=UPI00224B7539|nr:succinylglutamate desuccinylase/aspartoacylase family protein [Haladaptatus caseinilyticus]